MTEHAAQPFLASLPAALVERVGRRVTEWMEATGQSLDASRRDPVTAVFACSDFVAAQCLRHPDLLADLDRPPDIEAALRAVGDAPVDDAPVDDTDFMRRLRQTRNRAMTRIAWHDLTGAATLEDTLQQTSALADGCVRAALRQAQRNVERRHGVVRGSDGRRQRLMVVAMGKLGGGELNFSSDIDLVMLYRDPGASDGPRPLDSDRYFARVARDVIRLLSEPTGDGFVFRVDMRLRPFGSTGALALSFAAFETYLQQHGREWERYAYVKARPLTGGAGSRRQFRELVRPFVYRRYLDYGVIESLREMHALVAADIAGRERRDDIKLGPGGIREIEFVVQSFQLLRGGADAALRQPGLMTVLPLLAGRGWLTDAAAGELLDAYRFLRRVENRLQMWRDEQVHRLPQDEPGRMRIAYAMGYPEGDAFTAALRQVRSKVTAQFEAVVPAGETGAEPDVLRAIWKSDPGSRAAAGQLAGLGFAAPAEIQRQLVSLRDSGQYRHLDRRGRRRLDALIPQILRLAASRERAGELVARLLDVVTAVGRRSAYFALLTENPPVLARLTDLCAASPWLARRVAEQPILLDELIDPRVFEKPPDCADLQADLSQRFAGIAAGDLERQMEALRLFQQASVFRVAVADLSGVLPLMKVSDRLTDIAGLVLEKTVALASRDLRRRHGRPRCGDPGARRDAGFAVIGYGKLGGLELGYASDLDLVFLHDSAGGIEQSNGERPLDNSRYFARLGQRVLHMLGTTTAAGVLYAVDTRLRPSGKGGHLVSSLDAFGHYQRTAAWTWEHQALLRARAVAGDQRVCAAFTAVRKDVLTKPRDVSKLRLDVLQMRQRMRQDLPGGGPGEFDIKRDAGGLTDIEFIVQYQVLAKAAGDPELIRFTDNIRQLESLATAGVVAPGRADELTDIYRRYRQRAHRLALADAGAIVADAEFREERRLVEAEWLRLFGESAGRSIMTDLKRE